MRRIPVLFGAALLITAPSFAENNIAQGDADVVLGSAVSAVRSVPSDFDNMIDGTKKFFKDEAAGSARNLKAAFAGETNLEKAQQAGKLAVEQSWKTEADVCFRSYKISDEIGKMLLSGTQETGSAIDVSGFFNDVDFADKCSAYYQPKFKRLLVRQTIGNLLSIENVLADYAGAQREMMGHQVEIETKFIEVSQSTLDELSFSWTFGDKSGGDLDLFGDVSLPAGQSIFGKGLRTGVEALNSGIAAGSVGVSKTAGSLKWELAINAMEQASDTDVLSSPRVVARDGSTAIIRVGEEQMIPQSFEANNQDTSPFLEYADWDLQLMGVQMEVTPEIRDAGLIDLSLHPIVKDLIGYDPYNVMPAFQVKHKLLVDAAAAGGSGTGQQISSLDASLPYFRIREMETTVTVADGSTVGMGGLTYDKLVTYKDSVPLLGSIPFIGRLFRSEGESSTKRNLMIFVTATQVDVNGQTAAKLAFDK